MNEWMFADRCHGSRTSNGDGRENGLDLSNEEKDEQGNQCDEKPKGFRIKPF